MLNLSCENSQKFLVFHTGSQMGTAFNHFHFLFLSRAIGQMNSFFPLKEKEI
jgi:hypothetical protein